MFNWLRKIFGSRPMTTILAGHSAPTFTLTATDGNKFALADALKKGPVVLAFFKVSCPVCQYTFPFLERIHQAYLGGAVTIAGVSQDDARDTKEFMAEYGATFPALVDQQGYPVSNQYGLTNVPTVFLLAPDGRVQVSSVGFSKLDLEKISEELAKHTRQSRAPVFLPSEAVPDYKPG